MIEHTDQELWHRIDLSGCRRIELKSGTPLPLHSSRLEVWLLENGKVDVFAELRADSASLWREHLLTVEAGGALCAFPAGPGGLRIIVTGRGETAVRQIEADRLRELVPEHDSAAAPGAHPLIAEVDTWLEDLAAKLARLAPAVDYCDQILRAGSQVRLDTDERAAGPREIVWAKLERAKVRFLDAVDLEAESRPVWLPLCSKTWLRACEPLVLEAFDTASMARGDAWLPSLELFHRLSIELLKDHLENAHRQEQERLEAKASQQARERHAVLSRFRSVFDRRSDRPDPEAAKTPLLAACRRLGDALGVKVSAPVAAGAGRSIAARIEEIAAHSKLRTRQVVLRFAWWRQDSGPMLAFRRDDGQPVALLPAKRGRTLLWAPGEAKPIPVSEKLALELDPVAYSFYRSLPDKPLGAIDLLRFAARVCRGDLVGALACGLAVALLALLVPIATGLIIDVSIPTHQRGQLFSIALGLVATALAAFSLKICENIAILRVKGNVKRALEPALLDRLLRMPIAFFRQHSAGELAQRTMTIALIQSQLTGGVLSTLLAGLFSVVNFAIMIYLQPAAAVVAMLVLAVLAAGAIWAVHRQQGALYSTQRLRGRLASFVLQTVSGIRRIRLAGAEGRFFVRWGNLFMELREAFIDAHRVRVAFTAFSSGYQIFGFAVVFGALALFDDGELSTGGFLAFIAAFTLAMTAFTRMSKTLVDLAELAPMYRRVHPLLAARPEGEDRRTHPGILEGRIEINEVFFRYGAGTAMVLKGVSLQVESGESVAIVGSSGCGKSTLLRLILGFEQPTAGSIYFDGKDLSSLDLRAVRRQIGVVLQQDKLMEATLFENIRGVSEISVDDAWHAARLAGIAADIKAMPLAMHTVISAEGSDLSGGQAQRLLIARALAGRPRILLLDEATSALDNRAQATVVESLERLRVTRIAIAHRLSTVKTADRIFVLDRGRIVESGSFEDLIAADGLFAALVRRQLQ